MSEVPELDLIDRAIADEAWPDALRFALDTWRVVRWPELADVIDLLSARCVVPGDPLGEDVWPDRAAVYDPVDAATLLAHLTRYSFERAMQPRAPDVDAVRKVLDPITAKFREVLTRRITYLTRWPADPRTVDPITAWLERTSEQWPWEYVYYDRRRPARSADELMQLFAWIEESLRATADRRAQARFEALANRPSAAGTGMRAGQRMGGRGGLEGIAALATPEPDPADVSRVARWLAKLGPVARREAPPPPRAYPPDELWQQIALAPDDDLPRLVLADALIERDDPRGLLLAYQVRDRRPRGEIQKLIGTHSSTWFGPELERLLLRRGTRFDRGMLTEIRVGRGSTPSWVFDAAIGHRELIVVRTVRKHAVEPAVYARFVAALPNVRTIEIDSRAIAAALVEHGGLDRIVGLEFRPRTPEELMLEVLAPLAATMQQVATITLAVMPTVEQARAIAALFSRLALLTVPAAGFAEQRTYDTLPYVRFAGSL